MQSCRPISRHPRVIKQVNFKPTSSSVKMFPRVVYHQEPSFNPLLRLFDELESISREAPNQGHRRQHARTFTPKFDVVETEQAYELHGELGGVDRDNLHIDFNDPQTIVIRGRVERNYSAGTPPVAPVEDVQMSGAVEPAPAAEAAPTEAPAAEQAKGHQVTVEDEKDDAEWADVAAPTPATTSAEVEKVAAPVAESAPAAAAPTPAPKSNIKYWVSERSVGHFSRSFSFANRIEADNVSANLNNGILTVVVPKAKKYEPRHVSIN